MTTDHLRFEEITESVSGRFADGRFVDLLVQTRSGEAVEDTVHGRRVTVAATGLRRPLPAELRAGWSGAQDRLERTVRAVDDAARAAGSRVEQVVVDFELQRQHVTVTGSGAAGQDVRDLLYLTVRAIARHGDAVATGTVTAGTSSFAAWIDAGRLGRDAAQRAAVGLTAVPAPVAHLPVVVGPGRGVVLLHEACCHPLEGDEAAFRSVYGDAAIGTRIAAEEVTIIDDPGRPGAVGSVRIDDEGEAAGPTVLIDRGRVAGYLTDRRTAGQLGVTSSGNARRESHRFRPLPRMTNTTLLPGTATPAELIAATRHGLYAQHVGGGEVIESTGQFVFRVLTGYLIEDGRITTPVRETTVSGHGPTMLRSIDGIAADTGVGVAKCGKLGQTVPVGVIGPTYRVADLLVGGTAA